MKVAMRRVLSWSWSLLVGVGLTVGCEPGDEPSPLDPECGNGILEAAEECEDSNSAAGDGCSACRLEACGNFRLDAREQCDDGNAEPGDGCTASCVAEVCGNLVVDVARGEECDDGNLLDGDGCAAACRAERCGNSRVDFGELCDDGNTVSGDSCSADCKALSLAP